MHFHIETLSAVSNRCLLSFFHYYCRLRLTVNPSLCHLFRIYIPKCYAVPCLGVKLPKLLYLVFVIKIAPRSCRFPLLLRRLLKSNCPVMTPYTFSLFLLRNLKLFFLKRTLFLDCLHPLWLLQ